MSKVRFELDRAGVRALMRSPEMQAVLKARADTVKDRCGDLLKATSASRKGATVHEHKRHLKDGRVITVRSYQRKK